METSNNQESRLKLQSGAVDYSTTLRQFNKYGRGCSMKIFCEDEGHGYWKFCKLVREGQFSLGTKQGPAKWYRRLVWMWNNNQIGIGTQSQEAQERVCIQRSQSQGEESPDKGIQQVGTYDSSAG